MGLGWHPRQPTAAMMIISTSRSSPVNRASPQALAGAQSCESYEADGAVQMLAVIPIGEGFHPCLSICKNCSEETGTKTGQDQYGGHNIPVPARLDVKDSEAGFVTIEYHPLSGVHQYRVCEALLVNRLL